MIKKTIMGVFVVIVIGVFIGFNYLLIQNEKTDISIQEMEVEKRSNSLTISQQYASIDGYKTEINDLNQQITSFNQELITKDVKIGELEEQSIEKDGVIIEREDLINKFKQNLDVSLVGQQPREWIEFMHNKEYEKAYARFNKEIDDGTNALVLSEFRSYYSKNIDSIEIKYLEVVTRGIPENIKNDLIIVAVVNVLTPKGANLLNEAAELNENQDGQSGTENQDGQNMPQDTDKSVTVDLDNTPGITPNIQSSAMDVTTQSIAANPTGNISDTNPTGNISDVHPFGSEVDTNTDGENYTQNSTMKNVQNNGNPSEEQSSLSSILNDNANHISFDELEDDSIFKNGENQLFFLMNYKKEANDWEIVKIVQKL